MLYGEKRYAAPSEGKKTGETEVRTKKQHAARGRSPISFVDVVTLEHAELALLLTPEDAYSLLLACSRSLEQTVRDSIATEALLYYYEVHGVHFGEKCLGDYHQLIPLGIRGARGQCACNFDLMARQEIVPEELPLPKLLNARTHLLKAMCLVYEGIEPHCFNVLQVVRGTEFWPATMQPVVFSLAEGLAIERRQDSLMTGNDAVIDTDDVGMLTRLMDVVQPGFGAAFFSSRDAGSGPKHVLEAHWKGISMDPSTGATSCQFCENYGQSSLLCRNPGETAADTDKMMRLHCAAVYQPMKKFMLQHLKHVRYVRPPRGWNARCQDGGTLRGLIAGFTPAGVLCGVYVTSVGIPREWIPNHLASGHFTGTQRAAVEGK